MRSTSTPSGGPPSPESLAPSPVDPESIRRLVHRFYSRVRENFTLGPIFAAVIGDDWDAHLAKLCDFWETVLLGVVKYKGRPLAVHRTLRGLEEAHFRVWLNLFEQTAREIFSDEDAERITAMARRMARAIPEK